MFLSATNTDTFNPYKRGSGTTSEIIDSTWHVRYYPPTTCPCGWFPLWKRHTRSGAIRSLRRHIDSAHYGEQTGGSDGAH